MAFDVEVDFVRQFEVDCPYDRVFDVLADVPESAGHFPNVDALVDLGDNAYRWEMKKIGIDRFHIQTIYACKYTDNREKGWVKWVPVKGEGNGVLKGKWTVKALDAEHTRIYLSTGGTLTVPLPGLVKFVVAPFVVAEFNRMVDTYIENLAKAFEQKPKKRAARRS